MPRATCAPQTPARRLADLGFPLYACAFGQARGLGQARDVAIKDLVVNQTVFVKNELAVLANARIDGLVNQDVPVQLLFEIAGGKMEVVGTKDLHASPRTAHRCRSRSTTCPRRPANTN